MDSNVLSVAKGHVSTINTVSNHTLKNKEKEQTTTTKNKQTKNKKKKKKKARNCTLKKEYFFANLSKIQINHHQNTPI